MPGEVATKGGKDNKRYEARRSLMGIKGGGGRRGKRGDGDGDGIGFRTYLRNL